MTPYWLAEPAPELPRGNGGPVDVGIVGAGVTGCACALELAEAGLRVRVVDGRRVAEGASGRNGGFALRGTAAPYDRVVADLGRERALALWRWTEAELDVMDGLAGDAFHRRGSLRLAADAEEREDLRDGGCREAVQHLCQSPFCALVAADAVEAVECFLGVVDLAKIGVVF